MGEDIYYQHFNFGVEYFKENLSSFPDILGFGNTLFSAKKYPLVISLCEFGFDKVKLHESKRAELETRRKHLNTRERKIEEDKLARKATVFSGEEQQEIDTIKATRNYLDNLHPNLRLTETEIRKFNVDLATLMIRAALAESSIQNSDDLLIKVVKQSSHQMLHSQDIFKLSQIMDSHKWDLVVSLNEDVANRVATEEPENRAHADENEALRLNAMKHSLSTLYSRLHYYKTQIDGDKYLSPAEKKDYDRLRTGEPIEAILEWWVPLHMKVPDHLIEIAQFLFDKKNPEYVFDIGTQLATRLIELEHNQDERENLRSKLNALKDKVEKFKAERKPVPKDLQTEFNAAEEALVFEKFLPSYMFGNVSVKTDNQRLQMDKISISAIFNLRSSTKNTFEKEITAILDHSKNPKNLHALADHLLKQKETELAITFGEKCQNLIQEVETQREIRVPLTQSLKQLQVEEEKLNAQNKHLAPEKKEQITKLTEQIAKLPKFPKFADLFDFHQYDDLNLEVVKTMVSAISAKKEHIYQKGDAKEKAAVDEQVSKIVDLCLEKFTDPRKLLEFAHHMHSCKQPEVVMQVLERVFSQIKNIDKMRDERLKINREINKIKKITEKKKDNKLTPEKEEKLKTLEQSLANLPKWPHYAELEDVTQFNKTKFDAAALLVSEALALRSNLEASIKKRHFENPESANPAKEEADRKQANNRIQSSIKVCLTHLRNPSELYTLAKSLKEDASSALEIATQSHQNADEIQEKRATDELEQKLAVLQEEKAELNKIKKDLPIEDLKTLEDLQATLAVPSQDTTSLKELDEVHNQVGRFGITTAYDSKADLLKKIANKDFDAKQADKIIKQDIPANTQKAFDLCQDFVNDPKTLIEIAEDLGARYKEHDRVLEIGNLCLERIANLREQNKDREGRVKEREALLEEKQQLDKLRRKLTPEQGARLRELEVENRVGKLQPTYFFQTIQDYDTWALDIAKIMINNSIAIETKYEASLNEDEPLPASAVAAAKKKLRESTKKVLQKCLSQITTIPNLLHLANVLEGTKEYLHVITVGSCLDIEELLDSMRQQQEKYEAKLVDLKKLEQQFLQQKDESEKKKIESTITKRKKEIAKLEKSVRSYEEIRDITLNVTLLMMRAATAEDLGEILRDQTILAFKVDNTPERWDQVRALCSEEEWEKIKKELVGFVMKRDDNTAAKIELLLKDGLYEQCITIFPLPSVSEEEEELDKQISLLHKLYTEVDRHAIQHLDKLNPVVQRYTKRCFQLWQHEKMTDVLDILQRRYPDMIVNMYTTSCNNLLLNILPSQYSAFIAIIRDLQRRLVADLGLSDVWSGFITDFKNKHRSKKKLMQMLNLIGDSGWSLEQMIKEEAKGKGKRKLDTVKQEAKKSTTPAPSSTLSQSFTPKSTMASFSVTTIASDDDSEEETKPAKKLRREVKPEKKDKKKEKKEKSEKKARKRKIESDDDEEMEEPEKKKKAKKEESESDSEEEVVEKKKKEKAPKKTTKKAKESSDSESEEEEKEKKMKKPAMKTPKKKEEEEEEKEEKKKEKEEEEEEEEESAEEGGDSSSSDSDSD